MDVVQSSIAILKDVKFFSQKISASEYSKPIPLIFDSSIGTHTRHFIEFYQCLLSQAESKNINYCLRKRDLEIENSPTSALAAIDYVLENLEHLDLNASVTLATSKEANTHLESTIGRELHYNIEHCIHHLALIKIGLNIICPRMELPSHFGFAPSTIQHRKLTVQQ